MTDALSKLRELAGKMDHYISALTGAHAKDVCFRCQIEALLPALEQRERELRELLWMNHARYLPYTHIPYGDDGEM